MQACAQVSAQADVTPLQQHGSVLHRLGMDVPGSESLPATAFGSPQVNSMLARPSHWPAPHPVQRIAQCRT
jgi:hypothetical protein